MTYKQKVEEEIKVEIIDGFVFFFRDFSYFIWDFEPIKKYYTSDSLSQNSDLQDEVHVFSN